MNLINDKRFAKAYFQDRINLSNDGPLKIKQELKHNDIDEDIIEEIYSNFDLDTVYEKLDKLIQKKVRINRNKSNFILKQKIFTEMINLGYDKSMIANIVDKNLKENNYIINNEYIKLKNRLSRKYSGSELEERITLKLYQKGFSWDEINSIKNKEDF